MIKSFVGLVVGAACVTAGMLIATQANPSIIHGVIAALLAGSGVLVGWKCVEHIYSHITQSPQNRKTSSEGRVVGAFFGTVYILSLWALYEAIHEGKVVALAVIIVVIVGTAFFHLLLKAAKNDHNRSH